MVDALLESWRVLEDGGCLVDLRPLHIKRAVELLGPEKMMVPGYVCYLNGGADDVACAQAMTNVLQWGYFERQMVDSFEFAVYWEDVARFAAYAQETYCAKGRLAPDALERAMDHARACGQPCRVRMRYTMHLALYTKRVPPTVGSHR